MYVKGPLAASEAAEGGHGHPVSPCNQGWVGPLTGFLAASLGMSVWAPLALPLAIVG